jgi:conjugal transfer pilus assembly protein TraW
MIRRPLSTMLVALACVIGAGRDAHAQNQSYEDIARQMADQAQTIKAPPGLAEQLRMLTPGASHATPVKQPHKMRIVIFASFSLGEDSLRSIFETASGQDDVEVVFRGPLEGEEIGKGFRRIAALLPAPPPNVAFDPRLFEKLNVDTVPQMVAIVDRKAVARIRGGANPEAMRHYLQDGHTGDSGVIGPQVAIDEPDLIEVMKQRVAQLDFAKMKQEAINRYFQHLGMQELPVAKESRIREFDPTVVAVKDMVLPNGAVVWRQGDRVNPLKLRSLDDRVIIFDATDHRQVEVARKLAATAGKKRPIFIAAALDRDKGWDGLNALQRDVGGRVFVLSAALRSRFHVEAVPCTVEGAGDHLIVTEYPVDGGAKP